MTLTLGEQSSKLFGGEDLVDQQREGSLAWRILKGSWCAGSTVMNKGYMV